MANETIERIRSEVERCKRDLEALQRTLSILEGGGDVNGNSISVIASTSRGRKAPLPLAKSNGDKKETMLESIQRVLAQAGEPLTIKDIYKKLSEDGEVPYKEMTLRVKVYTAAQTGKIRKVDKGLFTLNK